MRANAMRCNAMLNIKYEENVDCGYVAWMGKVNIY